MFELKPIENDAPRYQTGNFSKKSNADRSVRFSEYKSEHNDSANIDKSVYMDKSMRRDNANFEKSSRNDSANVDKSYRDHSVKSSVS